MWSVMPAFGAAAYVPALVMERALFVRERNDGLYRVITYLLHKLFDELFIAGIMATIVSVWVFYAIQLQGSVGLFILSYYLTLCTGIVLAYFVAALSPNMDVANAALPTYVVTLLFFAGFLFRCGVEAASGRCLPA
jgi:ATP-binding cassette subfamily G (WHITE) protein 2